MNRLLPLVAAGLLATCHAMSALPDEPSGTDGRLPPHPDVLDASRTAANAATRGEIVDLGPRFKSRGLVTRDQGSRGTCSVFTITRAIEYAINTNGQHGSRLSVEFLNWASNQAIGKQRDGGFFSDLWTGFEEYGICDEKQMPYASRFEPTQKPTEDALRQGNERRRIGLRLSWIKPWDPTRGLTDKQLAEVKRTLRNGWPVCGGFLWPKKAEWKDGMLQMAARDNVRDGHSVLLVGYRDDPAVPGGGAFLIQNTSKGPRLGTMSYEYVRAYMNDAAWIGREEEHTAR